MKHELEGAIRNLAQASPCLPACFPVESRGCDGVSEVELCNLPFTTADSTTAKQLFLWGFFVTSSFSPVSSPDLEVMIFL